MKSTTLNHFHHTGREVKDLRNPPARAQRDKQAGTRAPAISMLGLMDAMASASIEEQTFRVNSVSMKKKNWPALFNKGVAKLREEDKLSAKKKEEIRVCVCVFSFRTH